MQHNNSWNFDPNKYLTVLDQWLSNAPPQLQSLDQLPLVDSVNVSWEWSIQTGHDDMFINPKRNDMNRVKISLLSHRLPYALA